MNKLPKTSGIYEIRNNLNGKRYVGSTKNFFNQQRTHLYLLRKGTHHSPYLQRAWNKYGEQRFTFRVVSFCAVSKLFKQEQWFLNLEKQSGFKFSYNIQKKAGQSHSFSARRESPARSKKTRKRMSISLRNYWRLNPVKKIDPEERLTKIRLKDRKLHGRKNFRSEKTLLQMKMMRGIKNGTIGIERPFSYPPRYYRIG